MLLTIIASSACDAGDLPTALVAAETHPALSIAAELPTLAWLVERAYESEPGTPDWQSVATSTLRAWEESEAQSDAAGRLARRRVVYGAILPHLAERLTQADLEDALVGQAAWIATASSIVASGGDLPLEGIAAALESGRSWVRRARAYLRTGEWESAILATIRAGDELLETTPRVIALRWTTAADAELRERLARRPNGYPSGASDSTRLARADRLIRHARQAYADGDHARAIQRAYYIMPGRSSQGGDPWRPSLGVSDSRSRIRGRKTRASQSVFRGIRGHETAH